VISDKTHVELILGVKCGNELSENEIRLLVSGDAKLRTIPVVDGQSTTKWNEECSSWMAG
jgi:hypothetical protein